jgi:hypothetical protein
MLFAFSPVEPVGPALPRGHGVRVPAGTTSKWQLIWGGRGKEKISQALQKSGSAMPVGPEASTPMARAAAYRDAVMRHQFSAYQVPIAAAHARRGEAGCPVPQPRSRATPGPTLHPSRRRQHGSADSQASARRRGRIAALVRRPEPRRPSPAVSLLNTVGRPLADTRFGMGECAQLREDRGIQDLVQPRERTAGNGSVKYAMIKGEPNHDVAGGIGRSIAQQARLGRP